jgi:hypothetical protein
MLQSICVTRTLCCRPKPSVSQQLQTLRRRSEGSWVSVVAVQVKVAVQARAKVEVQQVRYTAWRAGCQTLGAVRPLCSSCRRRLAYESPWGSWWVLLDESGCVKQLIEVQGT